MNQTPLALGYRMPAEWEPHRATWLAWPYNPSTWADHLEGAEEAFVKFIAALLPHEEVHLLVPNDVVKNRAEKALKKFLMEPALRFHTIETGDIWFRDFGPLFVVCDHNGKHDVAWTKWTYNALGGKYDDLLVGDTVPDAMPINLPRFEAGIVLEGGSIDVNGEGILLTTESCLLSPDRNPTLTKEDIEGALREFLGVTQVLWLKAGIAGDDTTGHVDDVTRFVGPRAIVTAVEENPSDENYAVLKENFERLKEMHTPKGDSFLVTKLPMPQPFSIENRRMAASYANFYIANGVVVVPVYGQPSDKEAIEILEQCFPDRKITGIDCRELIYGYGALHCSSMQEPA